MFISQHHRSIVKFAILSIVLGSNFLSNSIAQTQSSSVEMTHDKGVQLINGDGVPVDLVKGRYYIHQSAVQGYPLGQLHLGILFYFGDGGIQNTACAQWWLEKASHAKGEVHDLAKNFLAEIRAETAMLSPASRALIAEPDLKLCQQLPEMTNKGIGSNPFKIEPIRQPKIDLALVQNAIISVPKFNPTLAPLRYEQFQQKFSTLPSFIEVIRASGYLYHDALNQLSEHGKLLAHHIFSHQQKEETQIANHLPVEPLQPVEVARNLPKKSAQTTTLEPSLSEQQGEPANNATRQSKRLAQGVIEGEGVVSDPIVEPLRYDDEQTPETKLIDLAATLRKLPENKILHVTMKPEEETAKQDNSSAMVKTAKVENKPSSTISPVYNLGGELRTASALHYTLQLGSASSPSGLYDQARRHKLSNYLVYETVRNGRQWYVLVYGEFANLSSAKRALKTLPAAIQRDKPWVRSLRHVQSELH
ncbi:SPOR domain-containing protein [Providencia vermicola]|uniref:SPOR domain-containing protein n=1 Tax=Providencia vermicola TaxID=333965 RepID=UPI0034D4B8F6